MNRDLKINEYYTDMYGTMICIIAKYGNNSHRGPAIVYDYVEVGVPLLPSSFRGTTNYANTLKRVPKIKRILYE